MSEAEFLALEPRERDAAVSEARGRPVVSLLDGHLYVECENQFSEAEAAYERVPHYTTSIAAAWELVEEMEQDGWHWSAFRYTTTQLTVGFNFWKPISDGEVCRGATVMEAICLAYLKARGKIT